MANYQRAGLFSLLLCWLAAACGATDPAPPAGPLAMLTLSPLTLLPAFSPRIQDYAVRCAQGTNTLTLTLRAQAGGSAGLIGPTVSPLAEAQTLKVSLSADQAAVVQASAPGVTAQQYWIRCLPSDFPVLTVSKQAEAVNASPGWYLFGNITLGMGESGFAMVVDHNGVPVWYRREALGTMNVDSLAHNTVSYSPELGLLFGTTPNGVYQIHHLDTGVTETVAAVGSPTDQHELRLLPNGNHLVISYPLVSGVDLTGLPGFGANQTVAECNVQELDPSGGLVWQWLASDHIDPVRETTQTQVALVAGVGVVDVYHCNSIDVGDGGDLLMSARQLDAVFQINRVTSKIDWKMGGTAYSKDGAALIRIQGDPERAFYRQHDARFLPNGVISLFDDHTDVGGLARGVEYSLDLGSRTATFLRHFQGVASSGSMGSYRRYEDGSGIIGWGAPDADNIGQVFTEVNANNETTMQLFFDAGNTSYRAVKVPLDAFDTAVLRSAVTAGSTSSSQ